MANIPVEKTSPGWLPWLLGLLAAAALGLLLFMFIDEPDDATAIVDDPDPVVDVNEPADADVADTDVDMVDTAGDLTAAMLLAAADPMEYVGRDVTLTGLRVMEVTGDKTFTVSPDGSDQMMLVVLDQEMTPGVDGIEGRYDVNAGQMVQIDGSVQQIADGDLAEWGISPTGIETGDLYVRAQQLDIDGAEVDQAELDNDQVAE